MNQSTKKLICLVLVIIVCIGMLPSVTAVTAEPPMPAADMKAILNSATVYPQPTGYAEIDNAIANILKPYESADTYTKVKALYDWTVKTIKYSWEGYSKTVAPAYECFTLTYDLTYKKGLQPSIPMDMVYRSHHSLSAKKGVCYDYGILFAVMARYVGLEAYVHTGYYDFEEWSGISGSGHHGWAEIVINGQTFVFDPQRDNRYSTYCGTQTSSFFGIPWESAWRYKVLLDTDQNAKRDAEMLPVAAHRHHYMQINVLCSPSGTGVTGTGAHCACETVTLSSAGEIPVRAWFAADGTLLADTPSYICTGTENANLIAMFGDDRFLDVPAYDWYAADVNEAAEAGIAKGVSPFVFEPQSSMNRAMVVQFLARIDAAQTENIAPAPFTDVNQNDWYAGAVNWAYECGIIEGISETQFAPTAKVSRQDFVTMIIRYLTCNGYSIDAGDLDYADASEISDYALEAVAKANAIGLIRGYTDNTVKPKNTLVRAEGITFIMRAIRYMEGLETA